jgi:putative tricarboxylic transport membrane protein
MAHKGSGHQRSQTRSGLDRSGDLLRDSRLLPAEGRCEPAPLLLGFVLGPLLEEHLRRAMIISRGDPSIFFTRPISLALLIGAAIALVAAVLPGIREKREEVF